MLEHSSLQYRLMPVLQRQQLVSANSSFLSITPEDEDKVVLS